MASGKNENKRRKIKTACSLQSLKFYYLILLEKNAPDLLRCNPEIGVLTKPPSDSDASGLRTARLSVADLCGSYQERALFPSSDDVSSAALGPQGSVWSWQAGRKPQGLHESHRKQDKKTQGEANSLVTSFGSSSAASGLIRNKCPPKIYSRPIHASQPLH